MTAKLMRLLSVPQSFLWLLPSLASATIVMAESEENVLKHKALGTDQHSTQNDNDVVMSQQMIEFFLQADDLSLDLLMDEDMEFYTETISDNAISEQSP